MLEITTFFKTWGNRFERFEKLVAAIAILVSSIVIVLIWFPIADTSFDEICYTDPAARYVLGKGFTSAAWYAQGPDTFWSSNVPLQQVLLILWFSVFGVGKTVALSANLFYVALGLAFLYAAILKSNFIKGTTWRVLFLVFFLGTDVPLGLSTSGRPDALCFLIASVAILALLEKNIFRRRILFFLVCASAPWASLSLAAAFAFFGTALLIAYPKNGRADFMVAMLGGFVGSLLLFLLYLNQGTLDIFLKSIVGHTGINNNPESFRANIEFRAAGILRNSSFHLLFLLGCFASFLLWKKNKKSSFTEIVLLWVTVLLFPLYMVKVGVFHLYYSWMLTIPTALFLLSIISNYLFSSRIACLVVLFFIGFSLFLPTSHMRKIPWAVMIRDERIENRNKAQEFVDSNVTPHDIAVVECQFWYPSVLVARTVFSAWCLQNLSFENAKIVTIAILQENKASYEGQTIGFSEFSKLNKNMIVSEEYNRFDSSKNSTKRIFSYRPFNVNHSIDIR